MISHHTLQEQAADWFSTLQSQIIGELEGLEQEYCTQKNLPFHGFSKREWSRTATDAQAVPSSRKSDEAEGGGGLTALLEGQLFEKAGVNFSKVFGEFAPQFAKDIPGAAENPHFWASGISLVIHPRSPLVPTVHMNTRMIVTTKTWFGGGADLTPMYHPVEQDTQDFHKAFQQCCDRHDPAYYPKFKEWADTYFYLPHRQETRGVGGIFYDYINTGDLDADFAFSKDVGATLAKIYPEIVRRHMFESWTPEQRAHQLKRRGRYVEFNLLYDRGTLFGLKTGGHTESILMSLPPVVTW